jgi:hypothetical protein
VLAGDIHFGYRAAVHFPEDSGVTSRINQIVSSPIRNMLTRPQRIALRLGSSRAGKKIGNVLRRSIRMPRSDATWEVVEGPLFGNCMAELTMRGTACDLLVESAKPDENGNPYFDELLRAEL